MLITEPYSDKLKNEFVKELVGSIETKKEEIGAIREALKTLEAGGLLRYDVAIAALWEGEGLENVTASSADLEEALKQVIKEYWQVNHRDERAPIRGEISVFVAIGEDKVVWPVEAKHYIWLYEKLCNEN